MIITPLFYGNSSGASVYYQLLSKELKQKGVDVAIISDKEEGSLGIKYFALFPKWAGQNRKFFNDIISYFIQNIKYLKIRKIVEKELPNTIIVHSSFFNHLGIFPIVLKNIIRKHQQIKVILDVRDRLIHPSNIRLLQNFDTIIACSKNVYNYVTSLICCDTVTYIPVPQENFNLHHKREAQILEKLNLCGLKYLLFVGSIKKEKGAQLLFDTYFEYRKNNPDIYLVIAGLIKTNDNLILSKIKDDRIYFLGRINREQIAVLMKNSLMCINLSSEESISRVCLEALSLGKPVILPRNIPEYEKHCSEFVMKSGNPHVISNQMQTIISSGIRPKYPIKNHYPEFVMPKYIDIL